MELITQTCLDDLKLTGYTYLAYRTLVNDLLTQNQSTGTDHSTKMLEYTRLNVQRMNKWDKRIELNQDLIRLAKKMTNEQLWVVLTEGWCGDAAQNLPVINKVAQQNDKIELKLLLRDQHPDLMDEYLTNGARSIPKLIVYDKSTGSKLFEWGPRPKPIQDLLYQIKNNLDFSYEQFALQTHTWYAKDKGNTLQKELLALLKSI